MAASDIITLDDAKDHLNMTGTAEDFELAGHITAASAQVEQLIGPVIIRQFVDVERYGPRLALDNCPVAALVSVEPTFTTGTAVDVAELLVHPVTGVVRYARGARLCGGPWDVTYTAGRAVTVADVPEDIALACAIVTKHLWETQRAPTLGPRTEFAAPPPTGMGFALPNRARDLLIPYRLPVIA